MLDSRKCVLFALHFLSVEFSLLFFFVLVLLFAVVSFQLCRCYVVMLFSVFAISGLL